MNFTQEELTLMMLYSPGTRLGLMVALREMRGALTEPERRLRSLTDTVLSKLELLTDEAFDALPLYPGAWEGTNGIQIELLQSDGGGNGEAADQQL